MSEPRPNEIRWTPWVVPNGGIDESKSDHELDDKRWKDGLDVEPLPTGCRARNGITKINAIPIPGVAFSNTTGSDAREFSNGTDDYIAQGITGTATTAANRLGTVAIRIAKKTGTPTSGVQLAVYSNSAGAPGTAITGLDFADFNTVAAATINAASGAYLWIYFITTSNVMLANGTVYHLVLKSTGGSGGNNYQLAESTAGNPYAGGTLNYGANGTVWTNVAAADLLFRIYAGVAPIQGILDYNLSDAVTERLLIAAGGELYKEVTGTMTHLSGLDSSLMASGADVHPAMNVGSDIAFISNGIDTPKKFFVRSAVEYWANDGIDAPGASPVVTATAIAGGSLPNDTYYVDYWFYDSLLGIKSNTRFQGEDSLSVMTSGSDNTIHLANLPATVARVGDRATHLRVSLRPSAGSVFRYSGFEVALGTTTLDITSLSLGDEPEYDDTIAPLHSIATIGANQRFIAGIKTNPTDIPWRVYASKLGITQPFYESFPSLNYRDFGRGDGDYITALTFIPPATLVVGMKNSVWALDARSFLTGSPVLISKNVGVAGPHSLMVVGRTLYFVSDADTTKGMMFWDGSRVTPLLAIDKTFKTFSASRLKYSSCAHLAPGDDRFQWWTLVNESVDRVVMYEYALDSFSIYRISGNILGSAAISGGISKIKIGGDDGFLYNADTGPDDDGTTIVGEFTTKRFDYGLPDSPKRVRFLRAEGDGSANSSLGVQFQPDRQGYSSFSGTLSFDGTPGDLLGAGILGSFLLGGSDIIITTRVGLNGMCRNAQPKFSSSTRWSLRGFTIGVQPTRRR